MSMPKRETDPNAGTRAATPAATPRGSNPSAELVTTAGPVVYMQSPARMLHEQLASRLEARDAVLDTRWPGAVRLGIIVGGSLGLWAAIIGTVTTLTA